MPDWLSKAQAAKAELDAVPRWRWFRRWRLRDRWLTYVSLLESQEWLRLGRQGHRECTCDRDTLADGMATPGCPTHAPPTCGACGHPLSSHDINPHNGEPFCEEYGCPCQAAFVRDRPA